MTAPADHHACTMDFWKLPWVAALNTTSGLLRRLTLPCPTPIRALEALGSEGYAAREDPDAFKPLFHKLLRYCSGARVQFDEALDPGVGSPFQHAVWEVVRTIPYGETRTYQWVAAQVGRPQAPRAAVQAIANNRVSFVVRCHRVIASTGALHGFGQGGLALKQWFLDLEQKRQ